jgi:predicted ferric reductase
LALVIFLALKNTPLAFLTAYSYERINILHQAAGYCTIAFAMGHGVSEVYLSVKLGYTHYLLGNDDVMGMVAGCAMLIILLTASTIRFFRYEVFYVAHIFMVIVILITAGMHRPDLVTRSTYIIIFAASIWVFDRAFRAGKILRNITGRATIHPLSDGGVRVVMRRTPFRAQPGAHVFLWIPKVRAFETHPFTIVSTKPLELVISPQDGFTKELSALAIANPGAVVRASCDGPYGTIPNFSKFDHVVLVAGGAGATFTFGVAHNLLQNMAPSGIKPMIHFIWVIREHGKI